LFRRLRPLLSYRNKYPAGRGGADIGNQNRLVACGGGLRDLHIDLNQAGADETGVGNRGVHTANGDGRERLERVGRIDGAGFRGEHAVDIELDIIAGMDQGGTGFDGGVADDDSGGGGDCRGEGKATDGIGE
jgi:hypothetical protein